MTPQRILPLPQTFRTFVTGRQNGPGLQRRAPCGQRLTRCSRRRDIRRLQTRDSHGEDAGYFMRYCGRLAVCRFLFITGSLSSDAG
jgi:hypothetical protein